MYIIEHDDGEVGKSTFSKHINLKEIDGPIVDVYISLNKYRQALYAIEKLQDSLRKITKECTVADMYSPTELIKDINKYY